MFSSAVTAYDSASAATESSRKLEARALFRGARLLEICGERWDLPDRAALLDEALRYNQKLWTFFQTELSDPANPLPADIRSNLLSLSMFMDRRIFELMERPDPAKLRALIEINRQLGAGLSQESPQGG
jgi:flagellar protein FlaF